MNTPKYSVGPNRSVSPLRGSTSTKPKYYSADDVNKIVRNAFEPKLQFLMKELEERQQTIAKLNNKLNANDQRLLQQSSQLEACLKRQKEVPHVQAFIISTINQLINQKMKSQWEVLGGKMRELSAQVQGRVDQQRLEGVVQAEMERIKESVTAFMDNHKRKSNSYWQKVKEALGKISSKMAASEKDLLDLNMKIDNFQAQRARDHQIVTELQNSKNVVKNLLQLRKSVDNIYQNYQSVLALQKGLKQRLEEQNTDSLWHQADFFKQHTSAVLPEEVVLEYSKEEVGEQRIPTPLQNQTQPFISPIKPQPDKLLSADLLQLQRTTPINKSSSGHSQMFSLNTSQQAIQSRIQNSTFLVNISLETRKEMAAGVRDRLLELIDAKQWPRPLEVRYDEQINYLKNSEGNYLFDLRGNMFKVPPQELARLEEERLLVRVKKREGGQSKVKVTHC